jgi:hypothetical protein
MRIIVKETMACPKCKRTFPADVVLCPKCGVSLVNRILKDFRSLTFSEQFRAFTQMAFTHPPLTLLWLPLMPFILLGIILQEGISLLNTAIADKFNRLRRQASTYEITITHEDALKGMEKDLSRNGKRLRVKIPANIKSGTRIRLRNARLTTDGRSGDIYITVNVK